MIEFIGATVAKLEERAHKLRALARELREEFGIASEITISQNRSEALSGAGCSESAKDPEGPGRQVNKPLMRKPRGRAMRAQPDRETAGTISKDGERWDELRQEIAAVTGALYLARQKGRTITATKLQQRLDKLELERASME